MKFSRLTAGVQGALGNSTGGDLVNLLDEIIDYLEAQNETRDVTVVLESIGQTEEEAVLAYELDPAGVKAIAERNQLLIEQALGLRDENGLEIPPKSRVSFFNAVFGRGYFPIIGDILLPVGSGTFMGQGCYVRRKFLDPVLDSISVHPTCFMPIGDGDENGILIQSGSSGIGQFTISGKLKPEGSGGNGIIYGHTPPEPGRAEPTTPPTNDRYWAARPNELPQKRFTKPLMFEELTDFVLDNGFGHSEITVPAKGGFSRSDEVVPDETVDIPLIRWVRAYAADGTEIQRWCNAGRIVENSADAGLVGIFAKRRMTTSNPIVDGNYMPTAEEERIYHKPIADDDTTTTVVVPGGLPAGTTKVEVSMYNYETFYTMRSQMTPYLNGHNYAYARCSYNNLGRILVENMPWNGVVLVDGAYNTFDLIMSRNNGLDGWYSPAGYEDFMHNEFSSCAAVNNGGWGLYVNEAQFASHNAVDNGLWPSPEGELVLHRKYTYIAAMCDFGNFDTYGNRGGAIWMGGHSNVIGGGGMEHHFDTHNIDPFGTSAKKDTADWNPCRWSSVFVLSPKSYGNDLDIATTVTDARRVTFCKYRYTAETPAPTNPDSNLYSAMSSNHVSLPRQDAFGSLMETRSKTFHLLHLGGWTEHEYAGGDMQSPSASNVGEWQGMMSAAREYLFRPWFYEKTPAANQEGLEWYFRFSSKHSVAPSPAGDVNLVADRIGLTDQYVMTHLFYESKAINMKGKTIPANGALKAFVSLTNFPRAAESAAEMDWENVSITMNYIKHETALTDPGESWDELPAFSIDEVEISNPVYTVIENAQGKPYMKAEFNLRNLTDTDIVFDPDTNARHWFKFCIHSAIVD